MYPWEYNRVPCAACGDVVEAIPEQAAVCGCGTTRIEADWDGWYYAAEETALAPWDLWSEDDEIIVVGRLAVDAALARAERQGRPVGAVLAFATRHEQKDDDRPSYRGLVPEIVACEDAESETWPETPARAHLEQVVAFGRRTAGTRLLVHCSRGIGRAPAGSLAILADRLGPGAEAEALERLLRLRPCAIMNFRMAGLADAALDRGGALRRVVEEHPLLRARHHVRSLDEGWRRYPTLLMPAGGEVDLQPWRDLPRRPVP